MKSMIRNTSVFSGAMILALALSVLATPTAAWSGLRDEIRLFHNFLQSRPGLATELRANPRLVNNPRFLEKRSGLARFLQRYPAVRREIVYNPHRVLGSNYRVNHRDWRSQRDWRWGYYR